MSADATVHFRGTCLLRKLGSHHLELAITTKNQISINYPIRRQGLATTQESVDDIQCRSETFEANATVGTKFKAMYVVLGF
ncbi:hypothetical protein [Singulisphaera acidiphila]|uniref:Uncharacterized protein n=1 Tax=Singulisphaera acidiphila (strain ATCC BAA-1392 / DSM 18658 / VKM B-2454 / MOB10) TaxID=886293 RepID=L0DP37_SINAD|nr:hypothetical protein [Singulisphaera acidiphila]AGA31139.1 hypothetical protein Sinac_7085 [Singulisphaera acidiphila DSM 18658]